MYTLTIKFEDGTTTTAQHRNKTVAISQYHEYKIQFPYPVAITLTVETDTIPHVIGQWRRHGVHVAETWTPYKQ